eukprot:1157628-Pelagomonas_calceolata.AAC.1
MSMQFTGAEPEPVCRHTLQVQAGMRHFLQCLPAWKLHMQAMACMRFGFPTKIQCYFCMSMVAQIHHHQASAIEDRNQCNGFMRPVLGLTHRRAQETTAWSCSGPHPHHRADAEGGGGVMQLVPPMLVLGFDKVLSGEGLSHKTHTARGFGCCKSISGCKRLWWL